jgi:hypothetical protein
MGAYGAVMALILLLLISAYKNFPAGLCALSFLLNLLLIVFCVLPLLYTVAVIALRDGCANVEGLVTEVLTSGQFGGSLGGAGGGNLTGGGARPVLLAVDYYFGDPVANANRSAAAVLKGVLDVEALKAQVNASVVEAVAGVKQQYQFRPQVRAFG